MNKCSIALSVLIFLSVSGGFAQTYTLPYIESFDSYPINQPLNGHGGIAASSHVYVTPYGVVGNCAEFQMADTATTDTIISPVIGPLTLTTFTSFYFRAVTISGGVPSVYHMAGTDKAVIWVGGIGGTGTLYVPQLTIDSADQNTTTAYLKVTLAVPSFVNGYTGRFKIITSNPSGNNWKLEFDSLVVADTALVIPPPGLRDSVTNIECRGQNTGGIKVIASGYPPYTYVWSTGSADTTDAISGVPAGAYSVTVTDSIGGVAILTDTVHQPAFALLLDSLSRTNATCNGGSNGKAEIYASGGTTPYQYLWSTIPPVLTDSADDLSAGNYSVTVTDAHGCEVTASVHISQPSVPFTISTSATSSSGSNGTATVTPNGGIAPITYLWSTVPPQTDSMATGLTPGDYEVTVSDGGGCQLYDTVFVPFPAGINSIDGFAVSIYPNPASDRVHFNIDGINTTQLKVTCTDMMGRVWEFENIKDNSINVGALATGIYMIKFATPLHWYSQKLLIQR